jgi:hypothetical protein
MECAAIRMMNESRQTLAAARTEDDLGANFTE